MFDLPSLARSLHSSRKLTPAQIRNRTGFLDSNDRPFIALETIQGWLADTQAPPPQSEARPSNASISDQPKQALMAAMPHKNWLLDPAGQDIVAQHLRRQAGGSLGRVRGTWCSAGKLSRLAAKSGFELGDLGL